MDFAEILEELRITLRGLCMGAARLSPEVAYGEDIADPMRLRVLSANLKERVKDIEESGVADVKAAAAELDKIAGLIENIPARPSFSSLCMRYGEGLLDARTVIYLTGWNLERLYDECEKVTGKPAPAAY